ncbi:MAG: phage integrase N-terminal SAM-like domain-containing protein [Candidatus Odinarchaeota archaeon]|nr:phage integrase N-terminal SAM-like domain-containing protein [Candidatus Odinarchaeota archaeon]
MARKRISHTRKRDSKGEKVGATKSKPSRTVSEAQAYYRSAEWMRQITKMRKKKGGGRKDFHEKHGIPKEDLWSWKQAGMSYKEIAEFLAKEPPKGYGVKISVRQLKRWFKKYPIPEDFQTKSTLHNSKEYKTWLEIQTKVRRIKNKTLQPRIKVIEDMWRFLEMKPPSLWTYDDIENYIQHKIDQGLSENTLRGTLVQIRSFVRDGLNRQDWLPKLSVKRFKKVIPKINYIPAGVVYKIDSFQIDKIEETLIKMRYYNFREIKTGEQTTLLLYLPSDDDFEDISHRLTRKGIDFTSKKLMESQLEKFYRYIPEAGQTITFKRNNKEIKVKVANKQEEFMWQAIFSSLACTGSRGGSLAKLSDYIYYVKYNKEARDNGLISIKLFDINWHTFTIKEIHEKMDEDWYNIPLSPRAKSALIEYLSLRFNIDKANFSNEMTRISSELEAEYISTKRDFIKRLRELVKEHRSATNEKDKKRIESEMRKEFNTFRTVINKVRLFPVSQQEINNMMYAVFQNALSHDDAILDQDQVAWTPQRLQEEPHVVHIFRKSFAANLVNHGTPMEVVSRVGVGWKDMSTLNLYYAHISSQRLLETYAVVHKLF